MATVCPNMPAIIADPRFQDLKERYKDRKLSDFVLAVKLKCFRNAEDFDLDWFPTEERDYKLFTDYLNRPIDNERSPKIKKEDLDGLYKAMTSLYSSPKILEQRLGLISRWFQTRVDRLQKSYPTLERTQIIRSQSRKDRNGYQSIMDDVFAMVKDLSTIEGQKKVFDAQNPNTPESLWESQKDFWQYRADEFAKIYENKEFLAALAAPMISTTEGIAIGIDGLTFNIKEEVETEIEDAEEFDDESEDKGEAQKGERFVDFRTLSMMSTISSKAKNLISKLNRVDSTGALVRDDLGYTIPLDIKQVAIALHKVLRTTEPAEMMNVLRDSVTQYPSLKSLVDYLEKNKDDRGIIYTNFKKAKSTYYYGYKDKSGRLDVHSSGNAADGYSLSSEAGANISIGSTGEEKNSVVDDNGNLKGNDLFAKLYDKEFYQDLKDIDWQKYSNKNDKTVNELASRLRGLGFQVTSEEIKDALSSYPADFRFNGGTVLESTPTEYLSSALRDIYDKGTGIIKLGDDLTGTHLYTYAQNSFSQISRVLSPIQKGEVEERIISGSKSLATNNNPNALHQLVDSISNAKHLSNEDYKKEMERDYGQYEGMGLGFGEDVQLTGWLADASGDTDVNWNPESFRLIDMTDSNKTDYEHLTKQQHLVNSYVMYMKGAKNRTDSIADNGRMYEIPIQADYETAYNFIFAPEYTREQLIERLAQEVECEAQRIAAIKERKANDPTDPSAEYIRPVVLTYEKRGIKFLIFPELNNNGFSEAYSNTENPIEAHELAKQAVSEQLNKILESELNKLRNNNFFSDDNKKLTGIKSEEAESVRNWILNSFYARQQITKLLYGGLENFKNTSDFEKRNMYAHATRIPLYTEAYYNGEKVGKENQRVVYISDDESKSAIYANIEKITDTLKNQGKITAEQAERMKDAYKNITTTDGQGIRTLDSMREVKIMSSLWTDADEQAYKNIKSGNYKPEDVEHFMVGLKPVYTGYEILAAQPGQYQKPQRVPVLHKYSEMVLLPDIMEGVSLQNDTVPFKAFNKINNKLGEKNKIDLFIFGSGVKVGSHSTINAFAKENDERILKDAESISNFVVNKINSGNFWVHTLPYKYYGISAATHADVVDTNIAWASQAEKEAWANILPDEKITINGKEMQATEARELYNKIKKARTIDTFENLRKLFYSDHQLATILKEELASKPYQSREISFILQVIDGEGSWDSPLYQPSIQHDAVALLSSILRKRLTKVPTKGANILQTSGFGMDMDASGFDETNAIKDSDKLEVKFNENGNFKYVEAYVPIYDSRLLQFADENGNISAERLNKLVDDGIIPESVLHFIAYRTPSDAEHSIIPCRVKGFIANAAGATIRLPKEIMPMTGHDYDGDKMRCHFKEFYIGYDDNKIRKDFDKFSDTEAVRAILDENADPTLTPYEVFMRNVTSESNPEAGKYRVVKDVEYDYSKTPIDNIGNNSDYRKLNNALVDLMFSQLTSPAGSMKMFIPGGSAETTMYARMMQIIRATKDKDVKKAIANHLVSEKKYSSETVSDALSNTVNLYNFLLNKSEDTLSDLVGIIEGSESPFTVTHASDSHEYMMDGAGMIGVYAVYNSAAAMFQRLNIEYKPQTEKTKTENGVVNETINVSLFNKTIGKLFNVLSHDALGNSSYSTLGLARLVNAAVDNGKNPVLGHLNQTAGLAPMTNFLFAAGLSEEEIHLIMNQPAVIELGKRMKDPNAPGFSESAKKVLSEIIQQLPNGVKYGTKSSITAVSTMKMDDYIKNLDKSFQDVLVGNKNIKESQIHLLKTLIHLYGAAAELDSFTKLTRPESNSGSIDSSLGGTVAKIIQLDNFRAKQGKQISGTNKAIEEKEIYFNSMTEDMMSNAIGDSLPEVAALNTYLKDILPRLFREKFPQTRESWMNVTKRIANQYSYERIPGKVVERIQSDMLLWKLLSNSNFITDNPKEEQRRILFDVPEQLRAFKNRIQKAIKNPGSDSIAEKFADNVFLNNLDLGTTLNDENNTVRRIRFKMNGPAVENTADLIRAGWDQLWRNEETKQLAEDLFKYNLYTNGFSYGRYEFFHYAPFSVVNGMNGYNQALKEILSEGWTDEEEEQFFHQYCRNHWGDKNLFQEIKPEQIPMKLRDEVGIKSNSNSNINIVQFGFIIGNAEYIIVPQKINGNREDKLYQVIRTDGGLVVGIKEATKLGLRNRNNQVMVQYNPKVRDYNEVKPIFKSNKVSWESKVSKAASTSIDAESGITEEERQAAIDDMPFAIPIPTAESVKKLENVAESTSKSNGKLSAEDAAKIGFTDDMFYLVERDEHGNPVRKGYPGTPGVVAKAREQQAFVELNKRLREILRKHGVSIGVLEEAEARLMAGGVTDFSTAHVLGEGMKELIRLSNGIEGEWALPEEFAHVAIEMLGRDHPLVSRLLNAIARDDAALEEAYDGMLDEYKKHYGDDREKLIVEAAGKLVAKHLFQHQLTKTPSIKNIVKKVCEAIKVFFKTWSIREVENAIFDAEGIASQLARDLLSGRLADDMSLDKISTSDKFLNIDKDLSEKNDIISKLMRKTRKQIDVLQRRVKYRLSKGGSSRSLDEAQNQLAKLEDALKNQKFETTIVDYLSDAMNFMKEMETATDAVINNSPANAVCRKLQVVRDTLFGYASVMQDIKDALDNGEIKDEANLRSGLREVSNQIEDYISKYDRISMKYFEKFLSNVYGEEGITINVGKQKGRRITIEEMARKADHDISMMSRLLHAASDIDDYVIQAMDSVTRDAKIAARKRALALRPKLEVAMAALIKEQGNRDQSWMYERTKVNGKIVRTGRYISEEKVAELSDAKKNFYKVFIELKHLADQCVPEMMVGDRKMIMLRKAHYEKMKDAKGVGEKSGEVWDSVKNSVLEMGDIDLENEQVVTDFADNKVDQLPLKFLNKGKNESYDDMTEDAATSLMAYIGMAFEYKEMNNVIGMLENARYMASKRDVQQRKGLKLKVEKIGDEKDFHYTKPYTVKQAKTNLQAAIDDFYQMHVYGHLRKDEGTFGKTRISKRKSVDTLNRITSLSQMALNLHQRIANVNTGFTQILVETAGGKIKAKDVAWATGVWTTHGAKRMSETGNTDYSDKLSLWMDYFDIHQDNGRDAQLTKYGRTRGSRVFNEGLLYAGLSIGEDFMAGTTALALSRKYKLKGPNGEESNMWDAYEVKYLDEANKTGAYLKLKEGYTKEDGTAITAEDEKKFQKEVIGTNFELQGIYNTDDRSAIQQHSLGALAIMYRKWIAPAMKRRYAGTTYSNLKGDFQEGYYTTAIRLLSDDIRDIFNPASEEEANKTILQILTDVKSMWHSVSLNWNKLSDYEKGNVAKAFTEFCVVVGLIVTSAVLTNLPPDDDDNKFLAWAQDIAITQILRLRSEIGSMAPTPMQASEALRIASSPFAALRPLRDSLNIFQLLWPSNYWEEVDSGRYKGRTKAHKYFMKLPVISMFRKLDNFVDPTDMINYYKNINN